MQAMFRQQHPYTHPKRFSRGFCGGHGTPSGSYLWIRDLGEHKGPALRQKHCSPAPQKELRWAHRLFPNHSLPLFLTEATLPRLPFFLLMSSSFSLCLPACAGAVHRTGPQWPLKLINSGYAAEEHPQLSVSLLLYLLLFCQKHYRNWGGKHRRLPLQPAQNCSCTMGGASPADRLGNIN